MDIDVFTDLAAAEPLYCALEAQAEASPFQRFAWIESFARTVSAAAGSSPRITLLRGLGGQPAVLLPLERHVRCGLAMLRPIGGKHASFHLPVASPEGVALLAAADMPALLRRIGAAAGGADVIAIPAQPLAWQARPNRFAEIGATPCASEGHETVLMSDGQAFLRARTSAAARKKLKSKRRALAAFGEVAVLRPSGAADIERALAGFLAQKQHRCAALGLPNPFADPATQAFLRAATAPRPGGEPPPLEIYALATGERIVAVFGLAVGFGRACGSFTSFDNDAAIARCSPGDILLHEMVADLCERGFARFDLGVGEARYKGICDQPIALVDGHLALTLKGRIAAVSLSAGTRLKARIKRDRRLHAAANRLRVAFGRARPA